MSDARLAGLLFLIAFLARAVLYMGTALFGTDSGQFLQMADWMSEGRFQDALSLTYHPMYPLLIAALKPFVPTTEHAGFWVSIVLGAGAVIPLFLTVRSIFGRPAALLTALIAAFHPQTVELGADVMSEGTFLFFFFWAVFLCRRAMEIPSFERSMVAGLAAVAAYLTRPEGILAVVLVTAWPLLELLRRRDRVLMRLGGVAAAGILMAFLAFPFLAWVRRDMGRWALSAKGSVRLAEKSIPSARSSSETGPPMAKRAHRDPLAPTPSERSPASRFGRSLLWVTQGIGLPLLALGVLGLRGRGAWDLAYYFSFPIGYAAGLLLSSRTVPHLSYRYLIPSLNMVSVLAAFSILMIGRLAERRFSLAAPALAGLLSLAMAARCFGLHRHEETPLRSAAAWIRAQGRVAPRICSTVDKIGYLAGGEVVAYPPDTEEGRIFLRYALDDPADFYVYLKKDLERRRPPYLEKVGQAPRIGPAHVFPDPSRPDLWTVYVHPAR